MVSTALFLMVGTAWPADLPNPAREGFLFLWFFVAIFTSVFEVVRHADCPAIKLGEPYGTLILTPVLIGMEVMMVAALMLTGDPDPQWRGTQCLRW